MLNKQQQAIVDDDSSRKLIIASAGSGKTSTIVQVIKKDTQKVDPKEMVAITFTRNAAKELEERLANAGVEGIVAETIHSFCLKILKDFIHEIGWDDEFVLFDQEDREDILNWLIRNNEIIPKAMSLENALKDKRYKEKIMIQYYDLMQEYNAIDLNMIIDLTVKLLGNKQVLEKVRKRHRAFYVDEFQDTYEQQIEILQAINPEILVIIGDPDQAIYEWNDAKPEYIVNAEQLFGCKLFKLETNYRSTNQIVNAAESLVSKNIKRIPKTATGVRDGKDISFIWDLEDSWEMNNVIRNNLDPVYKNNAIICRKNATAIAIADYLNNQKIPVNLVLSAADIMKKDHVKQIISIARVIANPDDNYSVMKAMRFLSETSSEKLYQKFQEATQTGIPLLTSLKNDRDDFNIVFDKIFKLRDKVLLTDAYEVMKEIISEFDVIDSYKEQHRSGKVQELDEFRKEVKKWRNANKFNRYSTSLAEFLRWAMIRDIQDSYKKDSDAVTIMTVHGSKGLEFDRVFIPNFYQGEFPMTRNPNIEEERRLAYVAMTRAKNHLFMLSCNTKKVKFMTQSTEQSIFIQEIEDENMCRGEL